MEAQLFDSYLVEFSQLTLRKMTACSQNFCRRITDATSRSQFLSEFLSAPTPDDSRSYAHSVQPRQDEPLSSTGSAFEFAQRGLHTSEQACGLVLRRLPASFLSMGPDQTLPSLLSLSPPSLPAGRSVKRSSQSIQARPSSSQSSLAPSTAQHNLRTEADTLISSTAAVHNHNEWPFSPAAVLSSQAAEALHGRSRVSALKGESSSGMGCATVMPWLTTQPQQASAQPKLAPSQLSRAPHTPQRADKRPSSSSCGRTPLQPAAKYTAGRLVNGVLAHIGMPVSSSKLQQDRCCVQAMVVGSAALQPDRAANRGTCIPLPASTVDYMALMGLLPQAHTAAELQGSQAWADLIASLGTVSVSHKAPSTAVAMSSSPSYPPHIVRQSAVSASRGISPQHKRGQQCRTVPCSYWDRSCAQPVAEQQRPSQGPAGKDSHLRRTQQRATGLSKPRSSNRNSMG